MSSFFQKVSDAIFGQSTFVQRYVGLPNTVPMIKGDSLPSISHTVTFSGSEGADTRYSAEINAGKDEKGHANKSERVMRYEARFSILSGRMASALLIAGKALGLNFLVGLLGLQLAETSLSVKKFYHICRQKNMPPLSKTFAGLEALGNMGVSLALGVGVAVGFGLGATIAGALGVVGATIVALALPVVAIAYTVKALCHVGLGTYYLTKGKISKNPNEKEACYGMAREQGAKAVSSAVVAVLAGGLTVLNILAPYVTPFVGFGVGVFGATTFGVYTVSKRIWPMNKGGKPAALGNDKADSASDSASSKNAAPVNSSSHSDIVESLESNSDDSDSNKPLISQKDCDNFFGSDETPQNECPDNNEPPISQEDSDNFSGSDETPQKECPVTAGSRFLGCFFGCFSRQKDQQGKQDQVSPSHSFSNS